MKENKLITTSNVKGCYNAINILQNRPKLALRGLGVFDGPSGAGKTTYAERIAVREGHLYLKLQATDTPKSFLARMYTGLHLHLRHQVIIPKGSTNTLFGNCCSLLEDHENQVIYIDEMNYALYSRKILDTIRDLVDETLAIVILIGEKNGWKKLLEQGERYRGRCNTNFEFKPLTREDVALACREMLEVPVAPEVAGWIYRRTGGADFREIVKLMRVLEEYALANKLAQVSLEDCHNLAKLIDRKEA